MSRWEQGAVEIYHLLFIDKAVSHRAWVRVPPRGQLACDVCTWHGRSRDVSALADYLDGFPNEGPL